MEPGPDKKGKDAMSLATIYSRAQVGVDSPQVTIEVHLANGLPGLSIVGLADTEVKESKDRVRAALVNSQFDFPARRITINLAPADLPKEGSRYDLPIAIGILAASGQIPADKLKNYEFIGELALSGEVRKVKGVLPAAVQCRQAKRSLVLPRGNGSEAALVNKLSIIASEHLLELTAHLNGQSQLPLHEIQPTAAKKKTDENDLRDVIGQEHAKRALEIAAAGSHNLLFIGPPGTGKTMLASRLPGILPPMTEHQSLESASIYSISHQGFNHQQWRQRVFRSPHHTASAIALVGGGSHPQPGEISLAHHGVLFLDELPEFDRKVLEVLREPLESGKIVISRATRQAEFPARFQLIAAMNPCPCGYLTHPNGRCHCSSEQVHRYRSRISGPLLDRIDMHVEVPPVKLSDINQQNLHKQDGIDKKQETTAEVRQRVIAAYQYQLDRSEKANAFMTSREIRTFCRIDQESQLLLEQAINKLGLSARSLNRILKVARTIADLEHEKKIQLPHISEALSYRRLDRSL